VRPRDAILLAAGLTFVISVFVPFGSTLLYPLTLFTTWVHEMGHGLTAIACGGSFHGLEIFANAGGVAHSSGVADGIPRGLVALGGLVAPPILGAAILGLVHTPRRARIVLALLALTLVISLVLYVRSVTGWIAMPLVAALLAWASWRGFAEHPERRVILVQTLGVLLAVDTLTRMVSYVFSKGFERDGEKQVSDIAKVADHFGGHYLLWGCVVTVFALGLLVLGLWRAWSRPAVATPPISVGRGSSRPAG
jgi:Peptidase M50B-like